MRVTGGQELVSRSPPAPSSEELDVNSNKNYFQNENYFITNIFMVYTSHIMSLSTSFLLSIDFF